MYLCANLPGNIKDLCVVFLVPSPTNLFLTQNLTLRKEHKTSNLL